MNNNLTGKYSKEQKATIYVALITAFVTTFTASALNLSIPNMGHEFNVSARFIGWVITAYMLAISALSVPFGRFADLTNRKRILTIGILVFAIASLFSAFAWNIMILILLRVLQGIGGAMIFSTNTATLISAFPVNQRGKVLGYFVAATYIGLSAGPVVGGILNHYLGWRSIFLFTFLLSAIVSYIAIKRLPTSSVRVEGNFDISGNVLYILSVIFIMYGLSTLSTGKYPLALIIVGIVLLVFFILHEKRTLNPIINIGLFANNPTYMASNITALLNYGATFAIGYLMSIYLQVVLEYSSQSAGMILIIQPIIMAVGSPYMGRLSDRV
ncbi:MAG: MFS transporter, partial [Peptostreptococcaceae bacterium]|nr:MFS transporter [Peptostreptococcaceae bacterium]